MIYENKTKGIQFIDLSSEGVTAEASSTAISLFSGAGGLDIGLEMAGFETKVCVENDLDCRETLKHNRPSWTVLEDSTALSPASGLPRKAGDIRDISIEEILNAGELEAGEVGLVVGGAPCQPFSNIGKKLGKNDERNGDLFLEFVRVVKGTMPKAFIFENVVGITQSKHSDVIGYMVEKFEGLGYGISHTILNAADYGVPQKRERFFLIGIKGETKPAFPLPTHFKDRKSFEQFYDSLCIQKPDAFRQWVSVDEAFGKIPEDSTQRGDCVAMNISDVVKNRMKLIGQGQNFKVLPNEMRPNCWKDGVGKHFGNDTFGRMVGDKPSLTIRTAAYNPTKGMYIHPYENRGLNTMELAALQSFPNEWVFRTSGKDRVTLASGGKQIGNAVPPLLGAALAKAIMAQLDFNEENPERQPLQLANC
ncbi:MAG: DNA cytosine methyltransferase [Pedobacter agri]